MGLVGLAITIAIGRYPLWFSVLAEVPRDFPQSPGDCQVNALK
jgi:hypothetical protein